MRNAGQWADQIAEIEESLRRQQVSEADYFAADREHDYFAADCEHDVEIVDAEPDVGIEASKHCTICREEFAA